MIKQLLLSPQGIVSNGLITEYKVNEGSGQVLYDYKNNKNGQLGSTAGADTNDPTWGAGYLQFDGDDYINIGNILDDVFTVESVISTPSSGAIPLCGWTVGAAAPALYLNFGSTSRALAFLGNNTWKYFSLSHNIYDSLPHHIVFLIPGKLATDVANFRLIIDGIEQATHSTTSTADGAEKTGLLIGMSNVNAPNGFRCYYFNIYNRVRTNQENDRMRKYIRRLMAGRGVSI